jgi:hypothetical protein
VLSPTLIRLEYAADGTFEDQPTMTAINRALPVPRFTTSVRQGVRVIQTSALTLRYVRGSGPFTPANVRITLRLGGRVVTAAPSWAPGSDPANLGGWRRALDVQVGPVPLHDGLLSRSGWYLLDDTRTVLFAAGSPGFAVRRQRTGPYQDGYFFGYGQDYARGLRDLRALTGPAPLLPRSAFGVWFSRYYAYTEQDYHDLIAQFRANRVPLDTLSVDTDWKHENNPLFAPAASVVVGGTANQGYSWNGWEWDAKVFPDSQRFLDWAHGQGLAVTLNIHPSIGSDDPQWQSTQARSGGLIPSSGECQVLMADPAQCGVFDWTNPRHLDAYFALHAPLERQGVDFFWLDWCCDASQAQAPGLSADTLINSRYQQREAARGLRWPAFSRIGASFQGPGADGDAGDGGGPGAFAEHRYTIHFTGDTCATWPMLGFEAQFTADEGNIGLPYVSHDIGSFDGVPINGPCQTFVTNPRLPDDLYVRWVQFGAFQPLDRLHSNHGYRLPWDYAGEAGAIAADFLRLRESLIPYLYTVARQSYDTGLPMARHLYLGWPAMQAAYEHPSEYTFGDELLVAPVAAPGDPARTDVWFPPGTWVDTFTGEHHAGPSAQTLSVPLQRMPVFARAGAIVPRAPYTDYSTQRPLSTLDLDVYAGHSGNFTLYEDAGHGFGYQQRAFTRTLIQWSQFARRLTIAAARGRFPGQLRSRAYVVRLIGIAAPRRVRVGGRAVGRSRAGSPGWSYDSSSRTLTIRTKPARTAKGLLIEV